MTMSSEPLAPVDELDDIAFIEEAAGQRRSAHPDQGRRAVSWAGSSPPTWASSSSGARCPGILLPAQIAAQFDEAEQDHEPRRRHRRSARSSRMLAQPIAGQISDRTRSRFGRRAPWIMIGALVGRPRPWSGSRSRTRFVGVVIAVDPRADHVQLRPGTAVSAVMPDRVPLKRRGTFAALSGIGLMVGALGGQIVGSVFLGSIVGRLRDLRGVRARAWRSPCSSIFNPDYSSNGARARALQLRRTSCARSGSTRSSTPTSSGRSPDALLLYTGLLRRHRVPVLPPHRLLRHRRPRLRSFPMLGLHQPRRHPDRDHRVRARSRTRSAAASRSSSPPRPSPALAMPPPDGSGPTSPRWMIDDLHRRASASACSRPSTRRS